MKRTIAGENEIPIDTTVLLAGAWLVLSAILFQDTKAQIINDAVVGGLCALLAVVALRVAPRARYLVVPVAMWLFISAWALRGTSALTVANHLTTATILLGVTLLPTGRGEASDEFLA